jgi:hypothetical protein
MLYVLYQSMRVRQRVKSHCLEMPTVCIVANRIAYGPATGPRGKQGLAIIKDRARSLEPG